MNATDDFGLAAASWPPTSLEAKILHISGDKFSKKMLKAGLVWNHEPTLAPGKLIENERALAAAKRAWAKGDTELWVPTSVPEKPLTLPNLQALTLNLEFAVRRAVDGDRPSQEIVLAALELSDRLVRVADVARRNIRHLSLIHI